MFQENQRVRAKVHMDSDCSDLGMGIQRYANKGDELIIRKLTPHDKGVWINVSHEHVTDRTFTVTADEIEPIEETDNDQATTG